MRGEALIEAAVTGAHRWFTTGMPMLTRRGLLTAAGLATAGLAVSCTTTPAATRSAQRQPGPTSNGNYAARWCAPVTPDYGDLAAPRNLRFAATMPEAVVLCTDPEDVAATVGWARKTNTLFAIRGGGHNYADASSSRGIIISTRRMNGTNLDGTRLQSRGRVRNADLAKSLRAGEGRLLLPGGNCPAVGVCRPLPSAA